MPHSCGTPSVAAPERTCQVLAADRLGLVRDCYALQAVAAARVRSAELLSLLLRIVPARRRQQRLDAQRRTAAACLVQFERPPHAHDGAKLASMNAPSSSRSAR